MTPGSSHVHKARTILNSQYSHKDVWSLSGWSKSQIKQRFESAMAVLKLRDHRTYAQALLSKQQTTHKRATGRITEHHTTHKGDPNALNQLMVNTDFNTSEVKESSIYVNKQDHQKVSWVCTVNNARDISGMMASNPQATHRQVKQCEPVAISNRFQVLDSIQEVQPITSGEDSSHNGHSSTSDSYLHEDFTAHQKVLQPDPDTNIVDYTSVPEYKKCKEQIGTKFGCVPLAPIYVYKGPTVNWDYIPDVLTAHKLIRQSNLPNFLGLRIPVRTNLNVDSWRHHLADYFDQQLLDLIQFGFPLDFDRSRDLQSTLVNHTSARLYPEHVDKYIAEEVGFQAMLGPLDNKPFDIHICPFMTREKSDSDARRTIMDLSFPKGYSINDGVLKDTYLSTNFQMHYPSIDSIIRTLNELGPSAEIFKVDISRAFRHIRIDPGDIDLLGLQHRGKLNLDLSLPFGYRLGAFFFSKISGAVRFIMNKNGHNALLNYIDDFIYCGLPSNIGHSYQFLLDLLQDLGLDISLKKLCPPNTKVICLGIMFDTVNRTISIPDSKLQEICQMCNLWSNKRIVPKNELQSLLGLLLYITKCVRPARFVLNRMLQL